MAPVISRQDAKSQKKRTGLCDVGELREKKIHSVLFCLVVFTITSSLLHAQGYLVQKNDLRVAVKPVAKILAYGFDLKDVRLLDGSPFKNAMEKDAAYLLAIEPKRLLHRFYLNAGLPTRGDVYGGWESEGLSGHTLGHYLSACAMMYASTGNAEFKLRVDVIVDELGKCQQARKSGYIGAIPNEDSIFWKVQHGIIKSSGFDLNGGWSPWYTVHKVMAGLTDSYINAGNKKALNIAQKMADWVGVILMDLTDEQLEKMRTCEYGGMAMFSLTFMRLRETKSTSNCRTNFTTILYLTNWQKKLIHSPESIPTQMFQR